MDKLYNIWINFSKSSNKELLKNYKVQIFSLLVTFPYRFILGGFVLFFIPVYMNNLEYSIEKIGQIIMIFFLVNALLLEPVAYILDKYKSYKILLILSVVIISLSILSMFYISHNYIYLIISTLFLATGMTINNSIQIRNLN